MLAQELDRVLKKKWDEGMAQGESLGLEKGLREGRQEGRQETLLHLLEKKFGITDEDAALVRSCSDPEKLDRALDIILFAGEKEPVLAVFRESP